MNPIWRHLSVNNLPHDLLHLCDTSGEVAIYTVSSSLSTAHRFVD